METVGWIHQRQLAALAAGGGSKNLPPPARRRTWEFFLVAASLRVVNAAGAPINPIAFL